MTRREPPRRDLGERRPLAAAAVHGGGAARMEMAAGRRRGARNSSAVGAISTTRPRQRITTRPAMCSTTPRLSLVNRQARPSPARSRISRLSTYAWIETSSAATGVADEKCRPLPQRVGDADGFQMELRFCNKRATSLRCVFPLAFFGRFSVVTIRWGTLNGAIDPASARANPLWSSRAAGAE